MRPRELTSTELDHVNLMYRDQPWLDDVFVYEDSWIARRLGIAFVVMNMVFIGRPMDMGTLIHEMMHRHQYHQVRLAYIPRCLYAQWVGGGYTLPHHPMIQKILLGGKPISWLNYEQQAVLMEQLWEQRVRGIADHRVPIDLHLA